MTWTLLPSVDLTMIILNFLSTNLKIALKSRQIDNFKKHFTTKKLLTTWQSKKLRNLLIREKFETKTIPKLPKLTGLFFYNNCAYHKDGYIIPCLSFSFKVTNKKKRFHGHTKIISLETVKMWFVFQFAKFVKILSRTNSRF